MVDGELVYNYKQEMSAKYHKANQARAKMYLESGYTVIVDNTNIKCWEARPYVEFAKSMSIPIVFIRVVGEFPNIHGVPEDKVIYNRDNMDNLTIESCLNAKYPWESK